MKNLLAHSEAQHDDEKVRVTRWDFESGHETGYHVHEHDYIVVPLTDGTLEAHTAEGNRRFELKAGQSYARQKGVAHNILNPGPGKFSFVEIEIKS